MPRAIGQPESRTDATVNESGAPLRWQPDTIPRNATIGARACQVRGLPMTDL